MEQNYVTVTLCITDITVELMIKMDFFDKTTNLGRRILLSSDNDSMPISVCAFRVLSSSQRIEKNWSNVLTKLPMM